LFINLYSYSRIRQQYFFAYPLVIYCYFFTYLLVILW